MSNDVYRDVAQIFRLLSHPTRLRIVDELRGGEACVCHLQALLNRPQPYMSQQLHMLREAGIIEGYKRGLFVYYRLVDPRVRRLLDEVLGPPAEPKPLPSCSCSYCQGGTSPIASDPPALKTG